MKTDRNRIFLVTFLLFATVSCGGGGAAGGAAGAGGGGGMPAMAVDIATLEAKPLEQTTEFVGTVKSRRSTEIQPQVEGFITRITAKPGQRVAAGALLMEIDSRVQQGQLAGLETIRAQRELDVTYARQEAERASKLLTAGAGESDGSRSRGKRPEGGRSAVADRYTSRFAPRRPTSVTTVSLRQPQALSATFPFAKATA